MKANDYKNYKIELVRERKRQQNFDRGKGSILVGIVLLLLALYTLPLGAVNVADICGDELKERKACYIDNLQFLHVKVDDSND